MMKWKPSTYRSRPNWWTSDHWQPIDVIRKLAEDFGPFDLDPCATSQSAKAPQFFTRRENGLRQKWHGRVFLNPPYSKPAPWLQKAIEETVSGRASVVVALLPSDVSTGWFHDLVKDRAEIQYWRGRIRFIGWKGTPIDRPRNGNIVAVYRGPDGDL
jgi:phage N-6-adenine-methyltransferase